MVRYIYLIQPSAFIAQGWRKFFFKPYRRRYLSSFRFIFVFVEGQNKKHPFGCRSKKQKRTRCGCVQLFLLWEAPQGRHKSTHPQIYTFLTKKLVCHFLLPPFSNISSRDSLSIAPKFDFVNTFLPKIKILKILPTPVGTGVLDGPCKTKWCFYKRVVEGADPYRQK